jgi:hypothetical protein
MAFVEVSRGRGTVSAARSVSPRCLFLTLCHYAHHRHGLYKPGKFSGLEISLYFIYSSRFRIHELFSSLLCVSFLDL